MSQLASYAYKRQFYRRWKRKSNSIVKLWRGISRCNNENLWPSHEKDSKVWQSKTWNWIGGGRHSKLLLVKRGDKRHKQKTEKEKLTNNTPFQIESHSLPDCILQICRTYKKIRQWLPRDVSMHFLQRRLMHFMGVVPTCVTKFPHWTSLSFYQQVSSLFAL